MVVPPLLHCAFVIALNAVPLVGVVFYAWSIGTTLASFWMETLVSGVFNVARIAAHRRAASRASTEPKGEASESAPLLLSYVVTLFPFSIGHGIFLFAVLAMLSQHRPAAADVWWVDFHALGRAAGATAALAAGELLLDLPGLRHKPFSWLRRRTERSIGRLVIFHLALLGGAVLLMKFETPLVFLPVLVFLKTLLDLAACAPRRPLSKTPPRWFRYLAKKMKKDADAEWADVLAHERERALEDRSP